MVDCARENLSDGLATGMVFDRFDTDDYLSAVRRACALYRRTGDWGDVRARAMGWHLGWDAAAERYMELYRQVAVQR